MSNNVRTVKVLLVSVTKPVVTFDLCYVITNPNSNESDVTVSKKVLDGSRNDAAEHVKVLNNEAIVGNHDIIRLPFTVQAGNDWVSCGVLS